jgi:outer membrane protein TolC
VLSLKNFVQKADNNIVTLFQAENQTRISVYEIKVNRDIAKALGNYRNFLKIYKIQEHNVETNQNNLERSRERLNLGQISCIEFRQAQISLINVQTNKNLAKYDAKLAELELLRLTGQLLNVEF